MNFRPIYQLHKSIALAGSHTVHTLGVALLTVAMVVYTPSAPAATGILLDWARLLTYGNSDTSGTIPWDAANPIFTITDISGSGINATVRFDPRDPRDIDTTTSEAEFDWIEPYFGTREVLRYWPSGAPGPNSTHIAFF